MNARNYLDQFRDVYTTAEVYLPDNFGGGLALEESTVLFTTLQRLYTSREVLFLGDSLTPTVIDLAHEDLANDREYMSNLRIGAELHRERAHHSPGFKSDRMHFKTENTDQRDRSEIQAEIEASLDKQQLDLMMGSRGVLDLAIIKAGHDLRSRQLADPEVDKPTYQRVVRNAVGHTLRQHRSRVANPLSNFMGAIDLTRYSIDGGKTRGGIVVEAVKGRSSPQKWVEASTEWDPSIYRTLAKGFEFDLYAALYEWALARRLPFVPVVAPAQIESGRISEERVEGNPRSDLLLCSLVDEKIIPLQAKFTHTAKQYQEGVRIITPDLLGLVDVKNTPVRDNNGRVKTGQQVTTHVGVLAHSFGAQYNSHRKGQKPRHPEYPERLARAFKGLDARLKDDVAPYVEAA